MTKYLWTDSEWTFPLIEKVDNKIRQIAEEKYKLDTYPNQIEIISSDQMLSAYSSHGIPVMYEHWSFGKQLVTQTDMYKRGYMGLAYEIVINSSPCISYLMEENTMTMQALVIAHAAYGHNSFFKNNYCFKEWTDATSIIDYFIFARNYIRKCEEKYGYDKVEEILDSCHALQHYGVDRYRKPKKLSIEKEKQRQQEREEYLQQQINELWNTLPSSNKPMNIKKRQISESTENLLYFIEKQSPVLEPWQRELVRIVRKTATYFYPQIITKVMNEGWACVEADTLIDTEDGLIKVKELVETRYSGKVWDGQKYQSIVNWFHNREKKRIKIYTKHGYVLHGGYDHKILINGEWKELNQISVGDKISVEPGNGESPIKYQKIPPVELYQYNRIDLYDGLSITEPICYGISSGKKKTITKTEMFEYNTVMERKKTFGIYQGRRADKEIKSPNIMDEKYARWIGMHIGDGTLTKCLRTFRFTNTSPELSNKYSDIVYDLWDIKTHKIKNKRESLEFNSKALGKYVVKYLNFHAGYAADVKEFPEIVLKSPKNVIFSCISGMIDTDGCIDTNGNMIYITKSEKLSIQLQDILLKYGIISKRTRRKDNTFCVFVCGKSAKKLYKEINLVVPYKNERIGQFLNKKKNNGFFKEENFITEIISIEEDIGDTYDFSVECSHAYRANAFINHNCFHHYEIFNDLDQQGLITEGSMFEFFKSHAGVISQQGFDSKYYNGINVYTLGYNIFRDIKRMCENPTKEDKAWFPDIVNTNYIETLDNIMRNFRDESFILQFLSPKVIRDLKLFKLNNTSTNNYLEVSDIHNANGYKEIRSALSKKYNPNYMMPNISVDDVNYDTDRMLKLVHHIIDGVTISKDSEEVLKHIKRLWGFGVQLTGIDKYNNEIYIKNVD